MNNIKKGLNAFGFFISSFNYLMIFVFIVSKWPKYWEHINYEYSHLTWLSSLNLILISLFCFLAFLFEEKSEGDKSLFGLFKKYLIGLLSVGFFALALDEKFQIHEKLREFVFIPNEVGTDIPGVGAGDFLHLIIAIAGLSVSYFIFQKLTAVKIAKGFFLSALLCGLASVIIDVTSPVVRDDASLTPQELQASIDHQFFEELIEINAIIFFLMTFYLLFKNNLLRRLGDI